MCWCVHAHRIRGECRSRPFGHQLSFCIFRERRRWARVVVLIVCIFECACICLCVHAVVSLEGYIKIPYESFIRSEHANIFVLCLPAYICLLSDVRACACPFNFRPAFLSCHLLCFLFLFCLVCLMPCHKFGLDLNGACASILSVVRACIRPICRSAHALSYPCVSCNELITVSRASGRCGEMMPF